MHIVLFIAIHEVNHGMLFGHILAFWYPISKINDASSETF